MFLFSWFKKGKRRKYPKVYITGSGAAHAKPKDVIESASAQSQIEALGKIEPKKRRSSSKKEKKVHKE